MRRRRQTKFFNSLPPPCARAKRSLDIKGVLQEASAWVCRGKTKRRKRVKGGRSQCCRSPALMPEVINLQPTANGLRRIEGLP